MFETKSGPIVIMARAVVYAWFMTAWGLNWLDPEKLGPTHLGDYVVGLFAVILELALFGVVPSALSLTGMAVTCAGEAMTVWKKNWKSSISSR